MTAIEVYVGSDGELTKRYYAELEKHGALGRVAVNLFRAQKCSARAKEYRGGIRGVGSYKGMAYDRKNWAMQQLCDVLVLNAGELGIAFGWKRDPGCPGYEQVLYVDLPEGQVSFHSRVRYAGPDYPGEWDGRHLSAEHILAFCDRVAGVAQPATCDLRHATLFP